MVNEEALAERLRTSIGRLVRVTRAHADALSAPHEAALGSLDREGALSIAALAERRKVRHQSMSRTVMELEGLGYVERRPDPKDGRSFAIRLTAEGRTVLDADRRARRDWLAQAIGDLLSPDEVSRLRELPDILDRLAEYDDPQSANPWSDSPQ